MRPPRLTLAGTAALLLGTAATALAAPVSLVAPDGKPAAIVDLRTEDGVRLVGAAWRYADAHLVEVAARAAGPDMRPSGPEVRATDIEPKAGTADFQDASWDEVPPAALEARRGSSRLSFVWYRVRVTVPDHIGGFDPTGSTLVLDTVVDDYAEIWVDGRLPLALGQNGGQVDRRLQRPEPGRARPRRAIPVSSSRSRSSPSTGRSRARPPTTSGCARPRSTSTARRRHRRSGRSCASTRLSTRLLAPDARVEKVATGFGFTEGPVWDAAAGSLLFSDPNENTIYRWSPDAAGLRVPHQQRLHRPRYRRLRPAGLERPHPRPRRPPHHLPARQPPVTRLETNGVLTVLADRYQGKRLNSPNDLVYRSDGTLYFTDPPFGLPEVFDDPREGAALLRRLRLDGRRADAC